MLERRAKPETTVMTEKTENLEVRETLERWARGANRDNLEEWVKRVKLESEEQLVLKDPRETKATWDYKARKDHRDPKVLLGRKASRVMME